MQDVAIKMVHAADAEAREKFQSEIAMLKFVSRDRNIVQFYGAGVRISDPHAEGKPEPRLWLITEYMEVRAACGVQECGAQEPACLACGPSPGVGLRVLC